MAKLIAPDGTESTITPASGKAFTLEELQTLVEGYIEVLRFGEGFAIFNEDGIEKKLKPNLNGSYMVFGMGARTRLLLGNVLIVSKGEMD